MRSRRFSYAVSLVAAGCAAVVVLAGCGGGEEEPSPSPSSSSASPSGSPTPYAAPVPERAKQRTDAGAIDFLSFYFEEVGRSQTSPGTVDFGPLSYPDCEACAGSIEAQRRDVANGTYTKERSLRPTRFAIREVPNSGDDAYVNYTFREEVVPVFTKSKGDKPTGETTVSQGSRIAVLRWTEDGWKLRGMIDETESSTPTP